MSQTRTLNRSRREKPTVANCPRGYLVQQVDALGGEVTVTVDGDLVIRLPAECGPEAARALIEASEAAAACQ